MIKTSRKQYYNNKLTLISSSLSETWSVISQSYPKSSPLIKKPMVMQDSDGQ